jgi:hypothetical protein
MTINTNSKIAALCYAQDTDLDFSALTLEMANALLETGEGAIRSLEKYDEVAFFDLFDGQIAFAHADMHLEFPGVWAKGGFEECLLIAVSSLSDVTFERLVLLLDRLVGRIEKQLPSDQLYRFDCEEAFSTAIYDKLIEQIWDVTQDNDALLLTDRVDAGPENTATIQIAKAPAAKNDAKPEAKEYSKRQPIDLASCSPDDTMREIGTRFDAEWTLREQALSPNTEWQYKVDMPRPTHPAVAADAPGAKAQAESRKVSCEETDCIRMSLYPPDEEGDDELFENPRTQTTLHRLSVHALNTSVIAFSLPVGAALLTLSLAGRESMALSARLMAATGSAIGFAQTDQGLSMLSFLI